jgi:hypothetical protein
MLRTLAISSLLFAGAVSVAHADVFRWVDDHGGVHYSDQWVPGSEVIKSNRPHPASTSSDSPRPTSDAQKPAGAQAAGQNTQSQTAEKAVKQDMAKVREQQCKEAKERYDKAIEARRLYKPADKSKADDREYLSDDEADAYRVKVRQDMQDACGKSAK